MLDDEEEDEEEDFSPDNKRSSGRLNFTLRESVERERGNFMEGH